MKKKLLAGLLASVMVFSLTACGGGGDQESSGGDSDGPYTVTMVLQGTQQPDEERIEGKINEILEKEVNAHLDIVVLPWASATQQLQLMLSGDERSTASIPMLHMLHSTWDPDRSWICRS